MASCWVFKAFEADIAGSIPVLLAGLKTAFATSIAGMVGAIAIKIISVVRAQQRSAADVSPGGATVDDLAAILTRISDAQIQGSEQMRDSLAAIEAALVGDGDSTIASQMERLRLRIIEHQQDVLSRQDAIASHGAKQIENQDALLAAFRGFASEMAENNSKALIEALEEVMRDFNTRINEQFGDNFRQLNEAVGRLLTWQDEYRVQMETTAAHIAVATQAIDSSRESLAAISERSGVLVAAAEHLAPVLNAIQGEIASLESHLDAFAGLRQRAHEAFPLIEGRLDALTAGLAESVQGVVDGARASLRQQEEDMASLASEFSANVRAAIDSSAESVSAQSDTLRMQTTTIEEQALRLNTMLDETHEGIRTSTTAFQEQIRRLVDQVSANLAGQVEALDEALGNELTRSLQTLGGQLAALSGQFVTDYAPLTERLREVVRIAEGVDR